MARWEIMLADGDRTLVEAHHWVDSRGIWLDGQDEHGEAVAHIPIARISWVKLDAAGGAQPGAQVAGDPALSISPAEVSSDRVPDDLRGMVLAIDRSILPILCVRRHPTLGLQILETACEGHEWRVLAQVTGDEFLSATEVEAELTIIFAKLCMNRSCSFETAYRAFKMAPWRY